MPRPIRHAIFALVVLVAPVDRDVCVGAEPNAAQASRRTKTLPPIPLPLLPVEQAWIVTLDAPPSAGGAMDAERVYIPMLPEQLQALSRATGAKVWRREIDTTWPPLLHDGVLYVAARDDIHALDPVTGSQKWRRSFDRPMIAPLASAGDLLVGVFEKGAVIAFAVADGRVVWNRELGAPSRHAAAADGATVAFALDDGRVVALNLADGRPVWAQKLDGTLNQPLVARDRVLVGTNSNYLYALDHAQGRLAWRWRAGGDVIGASADVKGGAYYASLDNVLRAVNRGNGNQRWIKEIPTRPALPPQTFGDGVGYEEVVVVTGITSEIDAFAAKTGAAAGAYVPPSDIQGGPLIDAVLKPYTVAMVVITRDGRALGLRPTAMMLSEPRIGPVTELPGRRLERERILPVR